LLDQVTTPLASLTVDGAYDQMALMSTSPSVTLTRR
jgi:hypothetical protein